MSLQTLKVSSALNLAELLFEEGLEKRQPNGNQKTEKRRNEGLRAFRR